MPEPLDPSKFHVLMPDQKKKLILVSILVIFTVLPFLGSKYYEFAINRPSQTAKETTVEIKNGTGIIDISKILYTKGVINSEFLFSIYVKLNRLDKSIQAGVYKIPAGVSMIDLVKTLRHGTNDAKVTFLEGWRVEEFARALLGEFTNVGYESFVKLAGEEEGYLFPDTYFFNSNATEQNIVDTLLNTFNKKTESLLTPQNLKKVGLTKEQAIMFASIIEREVSSENDRPIVAGILISRWKRGESLGADATIQRIAAKNRVGCPLESVEEVCPKGQQALDIIWWPHPLTAADLGIDSPYNTRKNAGLPPAPISSFGLSALDAVLNYKTSPYTYYLMDSKGVVHYAKTLEEHNQNIFKFL